MIALRWRRTPWGWSVLQDGHQYSIQRYRRGDGAGFAYVLRVDGSALQSPAVPYAKLADAKAEAFILVNNRKA